MGYNRMCDVIYNSMIYNMVRNMVLQYELRYDARYDFNTTIWCCLLDMLDEKGASPVQSAVAWRYWHDVVEMLYEHRGMEAAFGQRRHNNLLLCSCEVLLSWGSISYCSCLLVMSRTRAPLSIYRYTAVVIGSLTWLFSHAATKKNRRNRIRQQAVSCTVLRNLCYTFN